MRRQPAGASAPRCRRPDQKCHIPPGVPCVRLHPPWIAGLHVPKRRGAPAFRRSPPRHWPFRLDSAPASPRRSGHGVPCSRPLMRKRSRRLPDLRKLLPQASSSLQQSVRRSGRPLPVAVKHPSFARTAEAPKDQGTSIPPLASNPTGRGPWRVFLEKGNAC